MSNSGVRGGGSEEKTRQYRAFGYYKVRVLLRLINDDQEDKCVFELRLQNFLNRE